jgi:hypothetical protein
MVVLALLLVTQAPEVVVEDYLEQVVQVDLVVDLIHPQLPVQEVVEMLVDFLHLKEILVAQLI